MSPINRGLARVARRADQKSDDHLRQTFVDFGITAALEMTDHQVLFGRRGTGKTHAFRYLHGQREAQGDLAVYLDLRTVGSPEGLFAGEALPRTERAARLLVDLLGQLHDALFEAVLADDTLLQNKRLVAALDDLYAGITTVRMEVSAVEGEVQDEKVSGSSQGVEAALSHSPSLGGHRMQQDSTTVRERRLEKRQGPERIRLNFSEVGSALRSISDEVEGRRIWLMLDEWSSVLPTVQPLLGEFLVRCLLPLPGMTVKIAAIDKQSSFREVLDDGSMIGIELGADVTANVSLDDFMVFEQNEDRSRDFFRDLLTAHLMSDPLPAAEVSRAGGLIAHGFKDRRAFDELVRAAEGVPRDAINIASNAAMRASAAKISVDDVRRAAQTWYTSDKEAAIRSRDEATRLLRWVIEEVIRGKRSRGFLVNQDQANDPLLLALFDARVLHVVRRGYSAQDDPGERFDVWVIDYGAYVDLISTKFEPQGMLAVGTNEEPEWAVPSQDLRAIRRAILDLERFYGDRQRTLRSARPATRADEIDDSR